MKKSKIYLFASIMILVIATGCAGPLKVKPMTPVTPPVDFLTEDSANILEDQLRQDKPRYTVALPQQMKLAKSALQIETKRLYLPVFENNQYEVLAIDLQSAEILWSVPLPKKTSLYAIGVTASGDVYMDLNCNGHTVVFLDPATGAEKWRYGAGAKAAKTPAPFLYYNRDSHNIFVGGKFITIQDPNTYEYIAQIDRFRTDLKRSCPPFYKTFVYLMDDQYIILDNGMHAFSHETGEHQWSNRFPTIATRYHTGKNVGMSILAGILGGLSGSYVSPAQKGPDIIHPKPLVEHTDDAFYVAALSNLYRINRETGKFDWAYDTKIGFTSLIETHEDRLYLFSAGDYVNGIYCLDQQSGSPQESFQTPYTLPMTLDKLTDETITELSENKMWFNNLECYNDYFAGKKQIDDEKKLQGVLSLKDKIVILTADAIQAFDNSDGSSADTLLNPSFECDNFEKIVILGEDEFMAVSKNQIAAIDANTFDLIWKLEMDWAIDKIDKVNIASIVNDYLFIYASIDDDKSKGYIVKDQTGELVKVFDYNQSYRSLDYFAIQTDNHISIYTMP